MSTVGDTRIGWTEPPVTKFNPDLGNLDPRQSIFVQSGWFTAVKSDRIVPKSGLYKRIFGPLAVENHKGEALDGKAVDGDDFPPKPTTPRQRTVHAAVTAFGRLLGSVVAHECGHALGLDHNFVPGRPKTEVNEIPWSRLMGVSTNELMDAGKFATFHDYTGITGFDPKSGKAVVEQPIAFAPYKLRALRKLLPVFIMGPPGPDELRR